MKDVERQDIITRKEWKRKLFQSNASEELINDNFLV